MESIPYDKRSGKIWFNGIAVNWKDANIHIFIYTDFKIKIVFVAIRKKI